MTFNKKDTKNLLLNQISIDGSNHVKINEVVPSFSNEGEGIQFLSHDGEVKWASINVSDKLILINSSTGDIQIDVSIGNPFEGTQMFFSNGQIGINRYPLYSYKFDIGVSVNTRTTALHIGDGLFGLSMGNATDEGYLPQIIGVGSDENDAGLYFIGKIIEGVDNSIPAIVFDARNAKNEAVINRPIWGIASGSYTDYKLIMNAQGNVGIGADPGIYKLKVGGNIKADNIIIDSSTEIINLINEIQSLRERIEALEEK